jgi:hypothetical protein
MNGMPPGAIPPGAKLLELRTAPGTPTVIQYEHAGHKYSITIALVVNAIWPTGKTDPRGEHEFSMNMGYSILSITKDGRPVV